MSESPRAGVSIPGYQPVEKVGSTPSYGIWIRALQTRMNRKVLLKVLPPGAGPLKEFFAREISLAVRIDGRGLLAVIDEGVAGEVRYLVFDEAGGAPLGVNSRVTDQHWFEFAQKLEEVYRQAEASETVLAPLAPVSFRALPNGEVVIGDLGWVVPFGDRLPALDSIPDELRGAAVAAHNRHFLAISLESVARALGTPVPKTVKRAMATLTDAQAAEQKLPAVRVFSSRPPVKRGVPLVVQIVIAACIVAGGAWIAQRLIDPAPQAATDDAAEDPAQPVSDDGDPYVDSGTTAEDRLLQWRVAEAAAERDLLAAFDKIELAEIQQWLIRGVPLGQAVRLSLGELIDDHESTESAAIAALILRHASVAQRLQSALAWEPHRVEIESAMAEGRVTVADRAATAAARALGGRRTENGAFRGDEWLGWAPLSTETVVKDDAAQTRGRLLDRVQAQLAVAESQLAQLDHGQAPRVVLEEWQHEIERAGSRNRQSLSRDVESLMPERVFRRVLDRISAGKDGLLVADRAWADTLATRIEAQGVRYNSAKQALIDACRDVLLLSGGSPADRDHVSDWAGGRARLESVRPGEEFPRLVAEYDLWLQRLIRAERVAQSLSQALSGRRRAGTKDAYQIRTEQLRGSVRSVTPGSGFVLKVDGRREDRSIRFRDLAVATVLSIDPSCDEGGWLLALFFLGDLDRAVERARRLDPVPEWLADVLDLDSERREKRFELLVTGGDKAFSDGRLSEADQTARLIVDEFPRAQWISIKETKLARWIDAHLEASGPGEAFHNYESMRWDPKLRTLTIQYDFGLDGAKADWTQIRLVRTHRAVEERGYLAVRGSFFLSPDGSTDLFSDTLEAELLGAPLNRDAPNLNLVLWSGRPKRKKARGLLGGLGAYPLDVARAEFGDGSRATVLLPANVLGRVSDLEDGSRAEFLLSIEDEPKVRRSRITISLSDDGKEAVLSKKTASQFGKGARASNRWSGKSFGADERRGTVEIRTYESAVEVRRIRVEGRLDQGWWDRWRAGRVAAVFE